MSHWVKRLRFDAIAPLVSSDHPAIVYFARRDLLGRAQPPVGILWNLPECQATLGHQLDSGGWKYPGGRPSIRSQTNYDQLETYRQLGVLIYKFEMNRRHPAVQRAVRFLLSFQSDAGDFRGIYGDQYSPNYSAAITELLIRAGYQSRREVSRALRWLLSVRQDDGGWALPLRTRGRSLDVISMRGETLEPDRAKPSAHLITGIVVRAFAAHERWRMSDETRRAAEMLKSRFFTRDRYPDHQPVGHWLTFSYPFWWTDLLSALDSLSKAGYKRRDRSISRGLQWFVDNQEENGMWRTGRNHPKSKYSDQWVALAVCRVLKAYFDTR